MRGGLRSRLILDSVRATIVAGLEDLGWFDPTIHDSPPGSRQHQPLRYMTRPEMWDEAIIPNAFAISAERTSDEPQGLGGDVEDRFELYVDLFAQNAEFGWHVAGDIRDILLGKTAGRTGPVVDVYDFRQATPSPFTQVDIDRVVIDRADSRAREWQRYWFMVRIDIVDDYSDEFDALHATTDWTDNLLSAWTRIQNIVVAQ